MVYSRYYHRRVIMNMMENILPKAKLLLTQMITNKYYDYDIYSTDRNEYICDELKEKIEIVEEGMRSRHLCTNEEYLRGDDADIKIALKNEIPELMAEIELRISSLGPLSKNLQKTSQKILQY